MILSYADHDPHAAETEAVLDLYDPAPPADPARPRWRTLPGDLPLALTFRWLHANGIGHDYRRCSQGEVYHIAYITDEGYAALIRDVRPVPPTGVGR